MSLGLVRNTNQMLRFSRLILVSYSLRINTVGVDGLQLRTGEQSEPRGTCSKIENRCLTRIQILLDAPVRQRRWTE